MEQANMIEKISSIRELFKNIRGTLSRDEINKIRTKIYKKEVLYEYLSNKEKLTKSESKILNNVFDYFNKLHDDFTKLHNDLIEQSKYQVNIYALDLLFNEDDYYKPVEVKSAFDGNYVLYESNGDKNVLLTIPEYFMKIKPYLRDLVDYYNTLGEWKIQLSMNITFLSFTDVDTRRIMHSKSNNAETMRGIDAYDIIEELIRIFMQRYQEGLENKMKGSSYTFERVGSLEYHFHKVTLNRGSSYIPPFDWILHKKSTLDPHNTEDNRCFLYAIVIAINHENIANNPQRIANLLPFIANYNWDDIDFPAGHKDYSAFEKNNRDIALNVLYVPDKTQEKRQCYISKHNKERNTHANLLMITNGSAKWHYLAIKSISGLLRGITSTHNGDFYCLNCFHSNRTHNKLEEHEKMCLVNDFCNLKLPNEDHRYISSTPGKNTLKNPFIIYADLECLLFKIKSSNNTSNTVKEALHVPCGYCILTCCSFDKSKRIKML